MSITKLQEVFFFKWRWQVLSSQPNTWELGLLCFQRLHWLTKIDWNGFVFIGMHKRLVLRMADMVYFLPVCEGYASHHVLSEKMVFNIWTSLWPWLKTNQHTLQGTNISPQNGILKMIFLFPRWDMLIPGRVVVRKYWIFNIFICILENMLIRRLLHAPTALFNICQWIHCNLGFGGRCSTLFRETLDPKISGNQIIITQNIKIYVLYKNNIYPIYFIVL